MRPCGLAHLAVIENRGLGDGAWNLGEGHLPRRAGSSIGKYLSLECLGQLVSLLIIGMECFSGSCTLAETGV